MAPSRSFSSRTLVKPFAKGCSSVRSANSARIVSIGTVREDTFQGRLSRKATAQRDPTQPGAQKEQQAKSAVPQRTFVCQFPQILLARDHSSSNQKLRREKKKNQIQSYYDEKFLRNNNLLLVHKYVVHKMHRTTIFVADAIRRHCERSTFLCKVIENWDQYIQLPQHHRSVFFSSSPA
jgi:hypothetical protein